jgi:hypothetical protein
MIISIAVVMVLIAAIVNNISIYLFFCFNIMLITTNAAMINTYYFYSLTFVQI